MASTNNQPRHPIQVASRRSGVSPDTIRAWERRYHAVEPSRSGTNRRLYSDEDVERLSLLRRVVRAGRRISDVAGLPVAELRELATADSQAAVGIEQPPSTTSSDAVDPRHLETCISAIRRLDAVGLSSALESAALELSQPHLLSDLLMPLMTRVGELWHEGSIRVAHEHLTTSIVQAFLGTLHRCSPVPDSAPELVVATPTGQHHELGAMTVSVAASADGWRVTFLGANLPADEIAAAAISRQARALALSIVYPSDDPHLAGELRELRRALGPEFPVIAGGRAASDYEESLNEVEFSLINEIPELRRWLGSQRSRSMQG